MISTVIANVASSICTAVASIGPALSTFTSGVGAIIANVVSSIAPIAKALGEFATVFLQLMGVLKPGEKIEEIGERALQAAEKGITLGNFDDFDAYMDKLRNLELDPDKATNRSPTEKLLAGIGVSTVGLEQKFKVSPDSFHGLWLLPMANPGYFTPERMQSLIMTGKFTGDVFKYLEKSLSAGDSKRFEDSLGASETGICDALDQASNRWENIKQQIGNEKGE